MTSIEEQLLENQRVIMLAILAIAEKFSDYTLSPDQKEYLQVQVNRTNRLLTRYSEED